MSFGAQTRRAWPELSLLAIAVAVLAVCLFYGYTGILLRPELGFEFDYRTGTVTEVRTACEPPGTCLQEGDRVLEIGGTPLSTYRQDRTITLYDPLARSPEVIEVRVLRGDRELAVPVEPRSRAWGNAVVNAVLLALPLIFWLAGTVAALFLRPRNQTWLVFVAWNLLTALWLAAGLTSETHLGYASIVFHATIWLWIPVSIHLHLILPEKLFSRGLRPLLGGIYAGAGLLLVLDLARAIPNATFAVPTLLALAVSFGLPLLRLIRDPSSALRRTSRLMAFGILVGCLPVVLFALLPLLFPPSLLWIPSLEAQTLMAVVALVAIPLWPLSYLYALHRPELRSFSFRGNRLLGSYGFYSLLVFGYFAFLYGAAIVILSEPGRTERQLDRSFLVVTVVSALVLVAAVPPLRPRFQRWVDRRVFGIHYRPREVVAALAAKMPAAVDRTRLREILERDLLPTLMIRQSGLYLVRDGALKPVHEHGVSSSPELRTLQTGKDELSGRYLPVRQEMPIPGWIRLVLPLELQENVLGFWLLGARDPDDFYSRSDIELLENLANQIAMVLKSQEEMEERGRLQHQLLAHQKMEALGRLAAGVAHDFNNMLAVIMGATELALSTEDLPSEARELMQEVASACTRAGNLTSQLLGFSRGRSVDSDLVDLDRIVTDNQTILRSLIGSSIQLDLELAGELRPVEADPVQLEQALLNLALNAAEAMPEGGKLTIRSANLETDEQAEEGPDGLPQGSWVHLQVRDTGTGIDPEIMERLFEPFFTTKGEEGGTGLGLALVYGVVKQSSGRIFVDSVEGEGACFDIYLPAATGDRSEPVREPPGKAATESGSEEVSRTPRILLVDDDDSVRTLAWRMLRSWGFEVLQAVDGREALEVSRDTQGTIDLLVTDLVMPGMRGTELAAAIRDTRPETGILYISGYAPDPSLDERGEDEPLLAKPFTAAELREAVEKTLGRSFTDNRARQT